MTEKRKMRDFYSHEIDEPEPDCNGYIVEAGEIHEGSAKTPAVVLRRQGTPVHPMTIDGAEAYSASVRNSDAGLADRIDAAIKHAVERSCAESTHARQC